MNIFPRISNKKNNQKETGSVLHKLVQRGYMYTEIHRLREQITKNMQEDTSQAIMLSSPYDKSGTTLLVALLGTNCVTFTSMKVLLIDLNMRHPSLNHGFNLQASHGFTDFAKGEISLQDSVKKTPFTRLHCITSGNIDSDLSLDINRPMLEEAIHNLKGHFNLIVCDTSPLLTQNRNNIDPSLLSMVCDYCFIVVRDRTTTKSDLQRAVELIPENTQKLSGIIYNLQH